MVEIRRSQGAIGLSVGPDSDGKTVTVLTKVRMLKATSKVSLSCHKTVLMTDVLALVMSLNTVELFCRTQKLPNDLNSKNWSSSLLIKKYLILLPCFTSGEDSEALLYGKSEKLFSDEILRACQNIVTGN